MSKITRPISTQPIGIFDSGIGGLTVAQALVKRLPNENLIYFGDTAHLPYGDKSAAAIQAYSIKITQLLLEHQCKLILIACNSASAAAFELIEEYLNGQAIVVNVIDPVIHWIKNHYSKKILGLIGTKQTINSNIYKKKIEALNIGVTLRTHATPLLASAIEEGFANKKVIDSILEEYLTHPNLKDIEALILACTHYPVIKEKISAHFHHQVDIVDTSDIVANSVAGRLELERLLNPRGGNKLFYVSDFTESFAAGTRLFFEESIELKHFPIWE